LKVPNLVIGRPGYDNFLVATASLNNVAVVDATKTVIALHQTDAEGVGSGHRRHDSRYNRHVLGRYGHRGCEQTDCTKYTTFSNSTEQQGRSVVVALRRRSRNQLTTPADRTSDRVTMLAYAHSS